MPQLQTVNLNPLPRTQPTTLERTLESFANRQRENQIEQQDTDALRDIYGKYQRDGENIEQAIMAIQSRPGLSPSARVNSVNQLLQMQKYNNERTKIAQANAEKAEKKVLNEQILKDLEERQGLESGSLSAYKENPQMAYQVTKEPKVNQADRPIDPDQQRRIEEVMNSPQYEKATIPQKDQLLSRAGVSNSNRKPIIEGLYEDEKIRKEQERYDETQRYKIHKDSAKIDETLEKEAKAAQNQLNALKDVEPSIEKVSPGQLANVFRYFGETGKRISDALLTKDQAKIQASIPAFLEGRKELFGVRLSDADLALLSDKLPDIGKSREANKQIINIMKKYSKLSILRNNIAKDIKKENKGYRPLDYSTQIEDRFDSLTQPVRVINPANKRVVTIPSFELEDALNSGAVLYDE